MKQRETGFTLIELMIAIAIVGILSSFAISAYQSSVLKSGRSEAKVALTTLAQRQERFYTQNFRYATDMAELAGEDPFVTENQLYSVTNVGDATTFTLTAVPTAGERQADDARCATFTLNHAGTETATNDDCW